jgi:pimeloyl-ACP methyl ester carboxylesterase
MKSLLITTLLTVFTVINAFSQDISGVWHGTVMNPNNKEVLFVFLFEDTPNDLVSTLAIPTFEVSDIKPKATTFEDGILRIDGSNIGMEYLGVWNETSRQIEGTYKEGNMELELVLKKGNPKVADLHRPQEPVKPYPYYEEEVSFDNTEAGISLSGTFTRPAQLGAYPVVILISGSGRHDRDGSMMTHRPFLVLSDYLTRNNIAVLRYDDRGFGKSTGDFSQATTAGFAQDVLSAVNYLKSRKDINPNQIGLIGHSEGGIIAPLAANQCTDIAFIITMAATGIPGNEVAVMQSKIVRPFPVPDEAAFEENVKMTANIAMSDRELTAKRSALFSHNESYLTPILKSLGASQENIATFIENETEAVLRPWSIYFYRYNPANEFEKLNIPVLSLHGSKDLQVDADVNQQAIRDAFIRGKNDTYKMVEFENLNHLFQECNTCQMDEYKELEQTLSPVVLEEISGWIFEILE